MPTCAPRRSRRSSAAARREAGPLLDTDHPAPFNSAVRPADNLSHGAPPGPSEGGSVKSMFALVVILVSLSAGCAPRSQPSARAPLTERQRDSVLARSGLPGAPVVGRALEVSDRAAAHVAETAAADSLFQ